MVGSQVPGLSIQRDCCLSTSAEKRITRGAYETGLLRGRLQQVIGVGGQPIQLHPPRLGKSKPHHVLRTRLTCPIGWDRLFAILHTAHSLVSPQRAYHKITQRHHRLWRHTNLFKEGPCLAASTGSKQVWAAEITYLPTRTRCVYLSLIINVWFCKIVGHHMPASLQAEEVSRA